MGYSGFGLQKWIYTMRPRKPFSKQGKPIPGVLSENTEFKFHPVVNKGKPRKSEAIIKKYLDSDKRLQKAFTWIMLALILISLGYLLWTQLTIK